MSLDAKKLFCVKCVNGLRFYIFPLRLEEIGGQPNSSGSSSLTVMILNFRQTGLGKQCIPRSGSTLFAIPSASFGRIIRAIS